MLEYNTRTPDSSYRHTKYGETICLLIVNVNVAAGAFAVVVDDAGVSVSVPFHPTFVTVTDPPRFDVYVLAVLFGGVTEIEYDAAPAVGPDPVNTVKPVLSFTVIVCTEHNARLVFNVNVAVGAFAFVCVTFDVRVVVANVHAPCAPSGDTANSKPNTATSDATHAPPTTDEQPSTASTDAE